MSQDNKIEAVGSDGKPDGGFYAVGPRGQLTSVKVPKDGWRLATAADIKAAKDAEAKRVAAEKAAAEKAG